MLLRRWTFIRVSVVLIFVPALHPGTFPVVVLVVDLKNITYSVYRFFLKLIHVKNVADFGGGQFDNTLIIS
jgi:hypothetical protein